ncbi:aspartate kinase [candidate division KSB1 bacterium]|nr:aspartate kinase [candidate division KSB1 bacterium]
MNILVEKYGGTSLQSIDRIKAVAQNVVNTHNAGNRVVVVVSAMGKTTDHLEKLVNEINPQPRERELGMLLSTGEIVSSSLLAMAIQSMGKKAISLNGAQSGITTCSTYSNARIQKIDTERIISHLNKNEIVVVAGFQGTNGDEVTVLGRGGSDASAIALASALKAKRCHIFSDVNGVYTADPRLIKNAALLHGISYEEMIELAGSGSQVMMGRAVEIARKHGIEVEVSSSFEDSTGTIITRESELEQVTITGIALNKDAVMVDIFGIKGGDIEVAQILREITKNKINIILMSSHRNADETTNFTIIVKPGDMETIQKFLTKFEKQNKIGNFVINKDVAQISMVGSGIANNYGVAYQVFDTLATNKIRILLTSTSEIKISAIIPREQAMQSMVILHEKFELNNLERNLIGADNGKN